MRKMILALQWIVLCHHDIVIPFLWAATCVAIYQFKQEPYFDLSFPHQLPIILLSSCANPKSLLSIGIIFLGKVEDDDEEEGAEDANVTFPPHVSA